MWTNGNSLKNMVPFEPLPKKGKKFSNHKFVPADRSGSEEGRSNPEGRSLEAFQIEERPDPDSSFDPDAAQNHHNFQHHGFRGE